MHIATPQYWWVMLVPIAVLFILRLNRQTLGHSRLDLHNNIKSVSFLGFFQKATLILFWVALCGAFLGPQLRVSFDKVVKMTRDFVITVDISGSMSSTLNDPGQIDLAGQGKSPTATPPADPSASQNPFGFSGPTATPQPTRSTAAESAVRIFLTHRQGDRVGLLLFDDRYYPVCPLTDDLLLVEQAVPQIATQGGGTNFDGPNQYQPNVGAIQGAIDHFKARPGSATKVLVMVTDGEDSISETRAKELADQIKHEHIRMYVLGVGESWAADTSGGPDLRKFVASVNGGSDTNVIVVGNAQQMRDGFAKIDKLEEARYEKEVQHAGKDLATYLMVGALACFLLNFLLTVLVRTDN